MGESRESIVRVARTALRRGTVIGAALAVTVVMGSPQVDLRRMYLRDVGMARTSPKVGIAARSAVQVGLQFEFYGHEIMSDWSTGYIPQETQTITLP